MKNQRDDMIEGQMRQTGKRGLKAAKCDTEKKKIDNQGSEQNK